MPTDDPAGWLRRRAPRVVGPFTARWLGAVKVPLVIHDLSTGGCLILSATKTLPAERMTLEIDLPDRTLVIVVAESVGMRSRGFAMRFVDVPPATHARLLRSIEMLLQER